MHTTERLDLNGSGLNTTTTNAYKTHKSIKIIDVNTNTTQNQRVSENTQLHVNSQQINQRVNQQHYSNLQPDENQRMNPQPNINQQGSMRGVPSQSHINKPINTQFNTNPQLNSRVNMERHINYQQPNLNMNKSSHTDLPSLNRNLQNENTQTDLQEIQISKPRPIEIDNIIYNETYYQKLELHKDALGKHIQNSLKMIEMHLGFRQKTHTGNIIRDLYIAEFTTEIHKIRNGIGRTRINKMKLDNTVPLCKLHYFSAQLNFYNTCKIRTKMFIGVRELIEPLQELQKELTPKEMSIHLNRIIDILYTNEQHEPNVHKFPIYRFLRLLYTLYIFKDRVGGSIIATMLLDQMRIEYNREKEND